MAKDSLEAAEQAIEALSREMFRLSKEHHLRDMADLKLSNAQGMCLIVIGAVGPLTMGQIADYMALSNAAATSLVDRLVQSQWVTRQPDDRDRRIVNVQLTAEGQAIFGELRDRRCGRLRTALTTLTPDEQQTVVDGLQLFIKAMTQAPGAGGEP
jgi:DNA-binding MarR family transcriptional regulator